MRDLLRSPTYVARSHTGSAGRWEPLVSDAVWQAVQERIEGHSRVPHQASGRHLLTGFLRCDRCGSRMAFTSNRHQSSYRCLSDDRGSEAPMTCHRTVSVPGSDTVVLDRVIEMLAVFEDPKRWPGLRKALRERQSGAKDGNQQRVAGLDRRLAGIRHELAEIGRRLLRDEDRDVLEPLRDELLAERDAMQAERASLDVPVKPTLDLERVLAEAGGWGAILRGVDVPHQRRVLETLVERVIVRRTGYRSYEAEIAWTALGDALHSVQ